MLGTDPITLLTVITAAYLLGSVPTAVLVCHSMGIGDPRQQGSGNPGATNVLRVGNRSAAALTLGGDLCKGILAVGMVRWFDLNLLVQMCAAVAALTGHIWSLFLRFEGGKGVATMLGACLMLDYRLGLAQCGIWLGLMMLRRISSLAAISMALVSPLLYWIYAPALFPVILLMSSILLATHHQNIRKLLAGRESRL